jgi:conjugal transfer/type IV secretion protein DotA/TraY
MRKSWLLFLVAFIAVAALAEPAFAQATNPYNVSWAALNPGNDWAAQVIQSLFPVTGTTTSPGTSPGSETTVIQQLIGQLTGFVGAIACAFVVYTTVMNIHRAAESAQVLGQGQSWMFVVRVGLAGIMMFPLGGGFSAGQALVMQAALAGVGMAKAVYTNAIQAVGPDAVVIATPMIPGTQSIVAGIIDSELCMALVNQASGTGPGATDAQGNPVNPLIANPAPLTGQTNLNESYITYRYSLSAGNESGNPACGTVGLMGTKNGATTIAGVAVDMAAVQQAALTNVINSIRPQVTQVAANLWQNKTSSTSLAALQGIYTNGVQTYTANLTAAANSIGSTLNAAVTKNAAAERNGTSDLLQSEVQQSTLGWTAAGAYYLAIAKLNATTLSLLNATPVTASPNYDGIPYGLSMDLAPLETSATQFMTTLDATVQSSDATRTPNGMPYTLADAKSNAQGPNVLDQLFNKLNLTNAAFQTIAGYLLPQTQIWTDPFGGLMAMGQKLMNMSLAAMGMAGLLASATTSTGAAIWEFFTGNIGGAAATVAGHAIMSFFGAPIFAALLALLIPGIIIAYVLPMIPYVIWMAGVAGWIILVCEAMVAVPLWMLAHMTVGGDGLHGRAVEGWSLLFNVVFRPTLMVIGLFMGYFVFDCMSWLIRESFGIAVGFVLQNGWLVTNFIGLVVLLSIFVMTHVVAALMSFRMVTLLPHHLPRLIGFTSANRVDMDAFQQQAAWGIGGSVARTSGKAIQGGSDQFVDQMKSLSQGPAGYISGPRSGSSGAEESGMDSTLQATTDSEPREDEV